MYPVHLLPLIEIYCSPAVVSCPHVRHEQSRGGVALDELQHWGFIEPDPCPPGDEVQRHGLILTEKGRAFIKAILAAPLPNG